MVSRLCLLQGSTKELSAATLEKRRRRKQERDRKKRKRKELRAKEKAMKAEKTEEVAEGPREVACKESQEPGLIFNKVSKVVVWGDGQSCVGCRSVTSPIAGRKLGHLEGLGCHAHHRSLFIFRWR